MINAHIGELASLITAIFWTITALSFESAGKQIGSLAVNWIRLVIGFFFLSIFIWIYRGAPLPYDASSETWIWLSLSGFIGFLIGDLLLFEAFVIIGSRISMLIMAFVPPITAMIGWAILGETLTPMDILGMILTILGIGIVILEREIGENKVKLHHPIKGLLCALGGALGQAIGLVLSKLGMGSYDAFAATQIRIFAGIVGFTVLFFPLKAWPKILSGIKKRSAMKLTSLGAFFGPFLGVSFSLLAIQNTTTGVASTIMSIVPILIIPPAVILFKERITIKEILGAVVAVTGVAILFL